jgi:hypothetical protein
MAASICLHALRARTSENSILPSTWVNKAYGGGAAEDSSRIHSRALRWDEWSAEEERGEVQKGSTTSVACADGLRRNSYDRMVQTLRSEWVGRKGASTASSK